MISPFNERISALMVSLQYSPAYDNESELKAGLTAGDSGHGGANQGQERVHNSNAHLQRVLSTAEPA